MIVTPYREDPFLSPHHIHSFDEFFALIRAELNAATHNVCVKAHPSSLHSANVHTPQQFLSLSIPLDGVDPLIALQTFASPQQLHFYWENGKTGEAIAALGCAAQVHLSGSRRFEKSKQVVQQLFDHTLPIGNQQEPFGGPRVFCQFTFFDDVASDSWVSPAAIVLPQWHIVAHRTFGSFVANIPLTKNNALKAACLTTWETLSRLRTLAGSSHRTLNRVTNHITRSWPYSRWNGGRPASTSSQPLRQRFTRQPRSHLPNPQQALRDSKHRSHPTLPTLSKADQARFTQTVQSVLDTIAHTSLNKAVLAHALDVELDVMLDGPSSLQPLRHNHSDCYLFSSQTEQGQTFLCASPEKLLSIQSGYLTTEAIAGSAPRGKTAAEDARLANTLLHNRKELHEHQLVVNFISQRLANIGLNPQRSFAPRLLPLSTIQHLQTPIHAEVSPTLHPLDIVSALHPTPAVAGVPREMACELIQHYEPFERSLYAAPMGWIDYQGNSEFLVGIRSALLNGNQARLYAGAGIVQGSNPQHELDEIELKLRSLYNTLIRPNT
ncbi:MAG: isochorismate synthase [Cyanobacteria bacterium P01_A01_bin.37]